MTSTKPYLVRAFNEWILDNELTPYLLIDAEHPEVHIPREYVQDGRIVFNITPGIVSTLSITNEMIEFDARFAGQKRHIYAPMQSILAIYAKENGQGMMFDKEEKIAGGEGSKSSTPLAHQKENDNGNKPPPNRGKPNLRVVK